MKSPALAAVLNFILPGAGMLYLGKPLSAAANFLVALVAPFAWAAFVENGLETVHFVALGIAAGSAGFAHAVAGQMNGRSRQNVPPSNHNPDSSAASSL